MRHTVRVAAMRMLPVPPRAYAGCVRAIVSYVLLRAALFVAPFAILVAAQVEWYVALVISLLFAFAASAVFLRRQKAAVGVEIARMRGERGERDDEDVEDEAVDAVRATETDDESIDASSTDAEDGTVATTTTDPDLVTDDDASAAEGDARTDR